MIDEKPRALSLAALIGGLMFGLLAQPGLAASFIIDDFNTNQAELNVSPGSGPQTAASSASGAGIIGAERDLVLSTDPGSSLSSSSAEVIGGIAQLADNSQFSSTLLFQWDGADGDPNSLDENGLGAIDLTTGGDSAFEIGLVFDDLPATLQMTVYSAGGGMSEVLFPGTGFIFTNLSIFIPYALFTGNADFSSVGAIELAISSPTNGLDFALDFVQTGVTPVPLPGTVLFLGTALIGLGMVGRRDT